MIAGLPYDAEVEYLESTGTQYIDTGVNISDNDFVLSCDMRSTSRGQSAVWSRYFGSYVSETATCTRIINYSGSDNYLYGSYRARANAQTQLTGLGDYTERKVYVLSYGRLDVIHNGTTQRKSLSTTLGTEDTSTVGLFGAKMACYGFRITHSGSLVVDLIPVRFTNEQNQSEGAMYDRVSRKIFRNAGTGSFTIGPDVATPVMGLHFMPKPKLSARNYVQDGLIAMWDGIENAGWGVHDPNATTWKDLVGGVVANLTCGHGGGNKNPDMTWSNNALVYPNSLSCAEASLPSLGGATTIEVAYSDFVRASTYYALFDTFDDTVNFFKTTSSNPVEPTVYGRRPGALSGTNDILRQEGDHRSVSMFFDGEVVGIQSGNIRSTKNNLNFSPSAKKWGIGGPYGSNFWTGKIHSFRIYSRVLTSNEISANCAVDEERFNLT